MGLVNSCIHYCKMIPNFIQEKSKLYYNYKDGFLLSMELNSLN